MKKKLFLIALVLSFTAILAGCSSITGRTSLSKVKIKANKVESVVIGQYTGNPPKLNQEDVNKFIELFNNVSEGIIPEGELVSPDTYVRVYYEDGSKTGFYFYGKDYKTLELRAHDEDGERTHFYYFHSNELRDFVYELAEKYCEKE